MNCLRLVYVLSVNMEGVELMTYTAANDQGVLPWLHFLGPPMSSIAILVSITYNDFFNSPKGNLYIETVN